MGLDFLLSFLLFFHFLPRLSAQAFDSFNSVCPMDFECQNLGRMKFPFTNFSQPDCGLCMVDCNVHPSPTIKLSRSSGQFFTIIQPLPQSNIIKLRDSVLQNLLLDENSLCSLFNTYTLSLPNSPSISFTIKSNITLFRCSKEPQLIPEVIDYFQKKQYKKYESCDGFDIRYRNPKYYGYDQESEYPPPGCSSIHLPMNSWIVWDTELFQLLTYQFDLEWHLSDRCYLDCHLKGGRCQANEINEFSCAQGRNILATAIPGGFLLVIVLAIFFLVSCCKKRIRNFLKPSSKHDLEDGIAFFGVPVFSYAELEEATNNFDASKELGDGGFGTVYYGKLHDGREVAVKRLYENNFKRLACFMNEVEILTHLRHPNLVSLYGCTSRQSRELLLVYEYIPNGTIADHLRGDKAKYKPLTWPVRMNIAIETAGALAYLHASDIIHRDVKTNNILLDHNFHVKVADFGLSRLIPINASHISTAPQGTPGYVDPEYQQCHQLTDKSDVYSFGVVLAVLVSSMPAIDTSRNRHEINLANFAVNRIQRRAYHELIDPSLGFESDSEVRRMTTSVADLAFRCLQLDKEMRPAMDEVLETLKAIQDCNQVIEETKETDANTIETRSRMLSSSPEPEHFLLLKRDTRVSSLPKSVTDLCLSSSTNSSTSRSNP